MLDTGFIHQHKRLSLKPMFILYKNLFGSVLIQDLDVFRNHHLSKLFVAGSLGHIAMAALLFIKDGKIHARFFSKHGRRWQEPSEKY